MDHKKISLSDRIAKLPELLALTILSDLSIPDLINLYENCNDEIKSIYDRDLELSIILYEYYRIKENTSTMSKNLKNIRLMYHAKKGNLLKVKLYILFGADKFPDCFDRICDGRERSSEEENKRFKVAKYLIEEKNVDINMEGSYAVYHCCESGRTELAKYLLSKGAEYDVDSLIGSILGGNMELVKIFVEEKNVDVNEEGDAYDPLGAAINTNNIDMVKYLISWGAKIDNETHLNDAIEENNFDMVKLLVERGADLNPHGDEGMESINGHMHYRYQIEKPLATAMKQGNNKIIEFLRNKGATE